MTETLRLKYPVHTIEGKQLLSAGTELTAEVLERLAAAVRRDPGEDLSLLEHGSIRVDLELLMDRPPYKQIFGNLADLVAVWDMMASIRLPPPLMKAIDYFRENDLYTYSHTLMVFALTCLLAQKMGTDIRETLPEASAGPLHDIGKISVPPPGPSDERPSSSLGPRPPGTSRRGRLRPADVLPGGSGQLSCTGGQGSS